MQDNSDLIIRDCCEAEVAEFGQPDTICITVDVLREIVQRHSPGTCLHQITEPQAAPAAVAVPALSEEALKRLFDGMHAQHADRTALFSPFNWFTAGATMAEAALAATPAATPVVLPEPVAYSLGLAKYAHSSNIIAANEFTPDSEHSDEWENLYTEQQLRDVLATATGLPAQAVPAFCHVASLKLKSLQERGYQITGYALEKPVEGAQPERGFINHGGFVGWWWDGQSPQAQADARDAVLAHLDGLLDDAAAHIYPSDLNKFQTGEHTATVASVRMGNSSECSVPLYSREQVVEAFNTAQAAQGSEA
ncbi:hypothetical protein Cthiooxydans_16950 [Comamonas thiooxydans]|uniref:hypothetical protein n=1 Tax=Comamonas thiooxydans TaxID=363952 RepID=UPI001E44AAE8|nr:hypothetical protein [Comamonas thiooxydans]BDB69283.1 hypothetical protein Cthiooxydans_16950 [Comamonas thiooxydans]